MPALCLASQAPCIACGDKHAPVRRLSPKPPRLVLELCLACAGRDACPYCQLPLGSPGEKGCADCWNPRGPTARLRSLGPLKAEDRLATLALSLPSLAERLTEGVLPFEAKKLDAFARRDGELPAARWAARFVLYAHYSYGSVSACLFDMRLALETWDGAHRAAFVTWVLAEAPCSCGQPECPYEQATRAAEASGAPHDPCCGDTCTRTCAWNGTRRAWLAEHPHGG
jgi:hypothetical protein